MSESKINTFVTDTSVNRIQDGLDEITNIWGIPSAGSQRVQKYDICRASVINTWLSWINRYSSSIGIDPSNLTTISEVHPGEPMNLGVIDKIYDNTQIIKNWCNRSECDTEECDTIECNEHECNTYECDDNESNNSECDMYESDNAECDDSECDNSECDDMESCSGEW